MRQSGIVAAAGLVALDKMINRLQMDHDNTYKIAQGKILFNVKQVLSNLLMFQI